MKTRAMHKVYDYESYKNITSKNNESRYYRD